MTLFRIVQTDSGRSRGSGSWRPARLAALAGVLTAAACASAAPGPGTSASDGAVAAIVAEERAFTTEVQNQDVRTAFRKRVAPDGVAFQPNPATGDLEVGNAVAFMDARPVRKTGPANIVWWSSFAGAARSGDLGFSTGPAIFNGSSYGFVMTVWAKQGDGSWKFYFDGGPLTDGPSSIKPEDPTVVLAPPAAGDLAPAAATAAVARIEAALATRAVTDVAAAYRPRVAPFSRAWGSGGQPAIGWPAFGGELARRPAGLKFEQIGARSSLSGDLVVTYGWATAPTTTRGAYARVWQRTPKGWKIVIDVVQTQPKPAPKA